FAVDETATKSFAEGHYKMNGANKSAQLIRGWLE
ncbi:MAG: hypothetical protein ACI9CO_001384, partial [Candidatus Azotimanducaceae bacterium]